MSTQALPGESIGEWIRVFAVRFAQSRPDVSAEEAVATAISEFKRSHALAPEEAVVRSWTDRNARSSLTGDVHPM